jgi:hypothetical protein
MTSTTPPNDVPTSGTAPASSALPTPAPARHWTLATTDGQTVTGYLPDWATDDPSERNIPPGQLEARLADINHHRPFSGQTVRVYTPANTHAEPVEEEVLHGSIDCNPYATQPEARTPVVNLHLAAESWITDLDPDDLTHLANQFRTQADHLDHTVRSALIAARNDWTHANTNANAATKEPER